jgi:hypothetical protein
MVNDRKLAAEASYHQPGWYPTGIPLSACSGRAGAGC